MSALAGNRGNRARLRALTFAAAGASALSGLASPSAAQPAPPTTAEVKRATERFLDSNPARSPESLPPRAPSARRGPVLDTSLFPENRIVSFYGAPQLGRTIVGRKTPERAAGKLLRQASAYAGANRRPVVPAFDLIGVIATASPGPDRKYRSRQDAAIIDTYLAQAREIGARLMLDIQPGRANVMAELRALEPYLLQPDVDVAIDPEWNVGRRGVPGRTRGRIKAGKLNKASSYLQGLIAANSLPPKALVVHQFQRGGIKRRKRLIERPDVELTINFDGIGGRRAKKAGYARFSMARLFNGFSLFYRLDRNLMRPRGVLNREPEPDFVLYQ